MFILVKFKQPSNVHSPISEIPSFSVISRSIEQYLKAAFGMTVSSVSVTFFRLWGMSLLSQESDPPKISEK